MKFVVVAATGLALLAGIAGTAPAAEAAPYGKRHYGNVTPSERIAIARSQRLVNVLRARVRADGRVNVWERMQVRRAEVRHSALVRRLHNN